MFDAYRDCVCRIPAKACYRLDCGAVLTFCVECAPPWLRKRRGLPAPSATTVARQAEMSEKVQRRRYFEALREAMGQPSRPRPARRRPMTEVEVIEAAMAAVRADARGERKTRTAEREVVHA